MKSKSGLIKISVILFVFSIFISGCSRPKGVLNSTDMENVLVEMHMLEGTLNAAGMGYNPEEKDKYFAALLQKNNVTQAEFDSSLVWYTKNPKRFERVYINVMARIDTIKNDVNHRKYHPIDSANTVNEINLWNKATKYVLTKDSARTTLSFEIKNNDLMIKDFYELSFIRRVAPSDSSLNPYVVMHINYLNGTVDSIYSKTINDSIARKYSLKLRVRKDLKVKSITGLLLGSKTPKGKMSAYLDSIKLIRYYNPYKQDSLRTAVNKLDSTVIKPDSIKKVDTIITPKHPRIDKRKIHLQELKEDVQ